MGSTADFVSLAVTASLLIGYHLYFIRSLKVSPHETTTGWTYHIRRQWIKEIYKRPAGSDILAVQTLRNWILVSTFLASISVTIGFSVIQSTLNIVGTKYNDADLDRLVMFDLGSDLISVKAGIVVFCNFVSFFGFSQSIRYLNHVGFSTLVDVDPEEDAAEIIDTSSLVEESCRLINRGAAFFTIGVRGFYFAIPFVFWIFSPYAMLGATFILLIAIRYSDRPSKYWRDYSPPQNQDMMLRTLN
jgi:uncharacterized membrane protein